MNKVFVKMQLVYSVLRKSNMVRKKKSDNIYLTLYRPSADRSI